jgi:two-component system chemotaxis sensor kinase CheA
MKRRRTSLARRILALALGAAILPLGLYGAWSIVTTFHLLVGSAEQELRAVAERTAGDVERAIADERRTLTGIAEQDLVRVAVPDDLDGVLSNIVLGVARKNAQIADLSCVDSAGRTTVSSRGGEVGREAPFAGTTALAKAFASTGAAVVIFEAPSGDGLYLLAPVFPPGSSATAAVLGLHLRAEATLSGSVAELGTRSVRLLRSDGRVIVAAPESESARPLADAAHALQAAGAGKAHVTGALLGALATKATENGWQVAVFEPLDEAYGSARILARTAALGGLAAALATALVALGVSRRITQPLALLAAAAARVAESADLTQQVPVISDDEVGQVSVAFNTMLDSLRRSVLESERAAAERARAEVLGAKNRDLRLVLDNVEQGFLTIDLEGRLSGECSAVAERWLGSLEPPVLFRDVLARCSESLADAFRLGWDEVVADILPLELTLSQLPRELRRGEQALTLDYRPILEGGRIAKALVVVTDVTSLRERERLEAEQRETVGIFERVMRDRAGFLEFFEEAQGLVSRIVDEGERDPGALKRHLHTLKGNAAIFGIQSIADACHAIESRIADEGALPDERDRAELTVRWARLRRNLETFVGDRVPRTLELEDAEYRGVLQDLLDLRPHAEVARRINAWRLEPTRRRLERIADQARGLARRLGKGDLEVTLDDRSLRLASGPWAGFWATFVHAVRNAVDHGLESPAERSAQGKPVRGGIVLATRREGDELVVEISDDGRGIDWEAVRAAATRSGLPSATDEDLEGALFQDGLSTARSVTDVSGRGVGMGALRAVCSELGGRIAVRSRPGLGTTISCRFPAAHLSPASAATELVTASAPSTRPSRPSRGQPRLVS